MERIASVLYGKFFEDEEAFKLAYLGTFEVDKIVDKKYLLKFTPLSHMERSLLEDFSIDKKDTFYINNLAPIYIYSDNIVNCEISEENNLILLIMKDGLNHGFVYDDSEEGKSFLGIMTMLSFISTFPG